MQFRIGKNVLALLSILVFVISGGCDAKSTGEGESDTSNSSSRNETGRPVIGVSLLTLANPFFVDMADAMKKRGDELGYDVTVVSADQDPAKQNNQVEDFITRGVDAIVLCPVDSKAIGTSIRRANEASVPVFTADIAVLAEGVEVIAHVATDNYRGGQLAAEAMADALGNEGGKVAIIDHPEVESVILRTGGFESRIKELAEEGKTKIDVVAKLPGSGTRDQSFKAAEALLQSQSDLKGIFAINDMSALGVVAALEKAEKMEDIVVIGFDGMAEAVAALNEGKIQADIVQHPQLIGERAIQAVADYGLGKDVKAEQLIEPTVLKSKV